MSDCLQKNKIKKTTYQNRTLNFQYIQIQIHERYECISVRVSKYLISFDATISLFGSFHMMVYTIYAQCASMKIHFLQVKLFMHTQFSFRFALPRRTKETNKRFVCTKHNFICKIRSRQYCYGQNQSTEYHGIME